MNFRRIFRQPTTIPSVTGDTQHHIMTSGSPLFAKARRHTPDKLRIARAAFEHMLEIGIIRPSKIPWASPLYMVPKNREIVVHVEITVCLTMSR